MADFWSSYLGRLRLKVGNDLVLMPGARTVMERADGKILLERRADFDIWGLPGGNAEDGEPIEQTMHRELQEEVGINALNLVPFGYSSQPDLEAFCYPNGHEMHSFCLNFHLTRWDGDPHVADLDESLAIDWFDPAAPPDDLLPQHKRALKHFLVYQAGGGFQLF